MAIHGGARQTAPIDASGGRGGPGLRYRRASCQKDVPGWRRRTARRRRS